MMPRFGEHATTQDQRIEQPLKPVQGL
jgi:hypothetical protein